MRAGRHQLAELHQRDQEHKRGRTRMGFSSKRERKRISQLRAKIEILEAIQSVYAGLCYIMLIYIIVK